MRAAQAIAAAAGVAAVVAAAGEVRPQTRTETGSKNRSVRVPGLTPFVLPDMPRGKGNFSFTFVNFVGYDTNPLSERNGSRPSWHETPDISLRWRKQVAPLLRVTATADANSVRYFDNSTANEDELWGRLDAALTDGKGGAWEPYVQVKGTKHFDPSSEVTASRFYDAVAGVRRNYPLAGSGIFKVEFNAGRRQVSPSHRDATMLYGRLEASYPMGETMALAAVSKVRHKIFDAGSYTLRWTNVVALAWAPMWLADSGGLFDVSFSVEREFSGLPGGGYLEIDAGPSISFRWTF